MPRYFGVLRPLRLLRKRRMGHPGPVDRQCRRNGGIVWLELILSGRPNLAHSELRRPAAWTNALTNSEMNTDLSSDANSIYISRAAAAREHDHELGPEQVREPEVHIHHALHVHPRTWFPDKRNLGALSRRSETGSRAHRADGVRGGSSCVRTSTRCSATRTRCTPGGRSASNR